MVNCYICGSKNANQPLALKDSFTAHTRCKCPDSDKLCDRCYDCIEGKYKQCWYWHPTKEKWSKLWGRNWSWLICHDIDRDRPIFAPSSQEDGLLEVKNLPTRKEIREWLINPPNPPFTICIADSGQKHTFPFAIESQSQDLIPVLLEETLIYCNRIKFIELLNSFEKMMEWGFNKAEIVTGDYRSDKLINALKNPDFWDIENIVKKNRRGELILLVQFVAQLQTKDD